MLSRILHILPTSAVEPAASLERRENSRSSSTVFAPPNTLHCFQFYAKKTEPDFDVWAVITLSLETIQT